MSTKKALNKKCNQFTVNKLKEELLRWTCEKHATNKPLDRELLRHKALDLACKFGLKGFKCSNAWLTIFLKQHGFSTTLTNCCGPYFADYRRWIELMKPLVSQYHYKDLFNVDELVMYPNVLPAKLSAIYNDNGELIKTDQLTVLICCNSTGTEKLPPLICGRYNATIQKNDYQYNYDKNSSISKKLFNDWLSQLNVRMSRKRRKILLLLCRNRIHDLKRAKLSHVKLLFLPMNFPSSFRPLKRDVFHYVKMIYRRNYVNQNLTLNRKWSLKQIADNVVTAWKMVPVDLIVYSFQRTNFRSDNEFLDISCPEWDGLNTGITFRTFVTFDDGLPDTVDPSEQSRNGHNYNLRRLYPEVMSIKECGDRLTDDRASSICSEDASSELDNERRLPNDRQDPGAELLDVRQDSGPEIDTSSSKKCVKEIEVILNDMIGSVLENTGCSSPSTDINDGSSLSNDLEEGICALYERRRLSKKKRGYRSENPNAEDSVLPSADESDCKIEACASNSKERIDQNYTTEMLEDVESSRSGSQGDFTENLRERTDNGEVQEDFESGKKNWNGDGVKDLYIKLEERDVALDEPDEQRSVSGCSSRDDCLMIADCSTPFKRKQSSLNKDSVEGPVKKRPKGGDNWAKYYENHFVFGSQLTDMMGDRSNEEPDEECIVECCKLVSHSQQCKPKAGELGKSNFMIDSDSTPSSSKE